MHEQEDGRTCILAGDFNARDGEDLCLFTEGWQDVWMQDRLVHGREAWTWRRGANRARYDRVYARGSGGSMVQCVSAERITGTWSSLSDHVALRFVLRKTEQPALIAPAAIVQDVPGGSLLHPSVSMEQTGTEAMTNVRVVRLANAVLEVDHAFSKRSVACVRGLHDPAWTPESMELIQSDVIPVWADLPAEGNFKVAQPGSRGKRFKADDVRKKQDCIDYAKYKKWAQEVCGVTEPQFRELLLVAKKVHKDRRGSEGIPEICRVRNL